MAVALNNRGIIMARNRLERFLGEKAWTDRSLAKYTTMRVGGPAAIFITAEDLTDLRLTLQTVKDYELPLLILGRGSNLLVSDTGFPGVVLRLGHEFKHVSVEGTEITTGAGVALGTIVQTASRHGLGGLAFAVGIPGTIGAAIAVNAGAHGSDLGAVTQKIVYYSRDLELRTATSAALGFSYRNCNLPPGAIIIEARLGLEEAEADMVKHEMETNWKRRKRSQPLDMPSAGSVFKNPSDNQAAKLIDEAGLKGHAVGGAMVSQKHANFFVNTGEATGADFYTLISEVTARIKETFDVELELEIRLVGDWSYVQGH